MKIELGVICLRLFEATRFPDKTESIETVLGCTVEELPEMIELAMKKQGKYWTYELKIELKTPTEAYTRKYGEIKTTTDERRIAELEQQIKDRDLRIEELLYLNQQAKHDIEQLRSKSYMWDELLKVFSDDPKVAKIITKFR